MTDTAVLAAVKALENTTLKKFNLEGEAPVFSGEFTPLALKDFPVSTTFGIIGEKCFLDPNLEEEQASEGFTSFTYTRDGNLCAVMKNGQGYLSPSQVFEMLETGWEKAKEMSRIMNWRTD
jgi:exosome complex RNA-binding protein Rrp42 (RNase PH superfamily)